MSIESIACEIRAAAERPSRTSSTNWPVLANPSPSNRETYSPFNELQRVLFDRVFSALDGARLFPAAGHDAYFLRYGHFIVIDPLALQSVNPLQKFFRVPGGSVYHLQKDIRSLTAFDLQEAKRLSNAPAENVLILKGLQSLLSPRKLNLFIDWLKPASIVLFGSAAHDFAGAPIQGFPCFSTVARKTVELSGYRDVTRDVFSSEELALLDEAHSIGSRNFLWQASFFPATRVAVFRSKLLQPRKCF